MLRLRQPLNRGQVLDLAEFRITCQDHRLHLQRERHNEGIRVGERVVRFDMRGSKRHPAVCLDEFDGQLVNRRERAPCGRGALLALCDVRDLAEIDHRQIGRSLSHGPRARTALTWDSPGSALK